MEAENISLEEEKLRLERERLAIERDRLEGIRARLAEDGRDAQGKICVSLQTAALIAIISLLLGGIIGAAWDAFVSHSRERERIADVMKTLEPAVPAVQQQSGLPVSTPPPKAYENVSLIVIKGQ